VASYRVVSESKPLDSRRLQLTALFLDKPDLDVFDRLAGIGLASLIVSVAFELATMEPPCFSRPSACPCRTVRSEQEVKSMDNAEIDSHRAENL